MADFAADFRVQKSARAKEDPMSTQPNRIISRERLYSRREAPVSQEHAARFLNLHPKTVLRKAREGSLPAHPVGAGRKRWHFYLSELDQWLRSQVISGSHPRRQPQGDYIG
jgi:excisionase family DNA binding protein